MIGLGGTPAPSKLSLTRIGGGLGLSRIGGGFGPLRGLTTLRRAVWPAAMPIRPKSTRHAEEAPAWRLATGPSAATTTSPATTIVRDRKSVFMAILLSGQGRAPIGARLG